MYLAREEDPKLESDDHSGDQRKEREPDAAQLIALPGPRPGLPNQGRPPEIRQRKIRHEQVG